MAEVASKASALTRLRVGTVEVGVALYVAHRDGAKRKLQDFVTAGPSGGRLVAEQVAMAVPESGPPVDEPSREMGDPLADERIVEAARHETAAGEALTEEQFTEAARRMVEFAPDRQAAAREALAAEAEGDARSRFKAELAAAGLTAEYARTARPAEERVEGEYRRQLVEEGTGEVVPPESVRRGVRRSDGAFVDCTAELARIEEITRLDEMAVVAFVDETKVPRQRVKCAYHVGANDEAAPKGLRLLWEGMRLRRRAAVVKLTKRSRQSLGLIVAVSDSLMLLELAFAEDCRPTPPRALAIFGAGVQVSERELEMVEGLIEAWSDSPAVIDSLRDDAIARREELYARALAGDFTGGVEAEVGPSAEETALLAELEASLAAATVS